MPEIVGKKLVSISSVNPLSSHISHLRHLSRPYSLTLILNKRFGFSKSEANNKSKIIAGHINQALDFHKASLSESSTAIKPVLQYYAYLNLAVAVVLTYKPKNYIHRYRNHGVHDLTAQLGSISLRKPVISSAVGAVTLLNEVVSDIDITNQSFNLKELFSAIPFVSSELHASFGIRPEHIFLLERLGTVGNSNLNSIIEFQFESAYSVQRRTAFRKQLESIMPTLSGSFRFSGGDNQGLCYRSIRHFDKTKRSHAVAFHRKNCIRLINFGGHRISEDDNLIYSWHYVKGTRLLPTISACLLTSFCLATLARYRPMLQAKLYQSRLNILVDVFQNEVDLTLIPAFRNLLYREEQIVKTPSIS